MILGKEMYQTTQHQKPNTFTIFNTPLPLADRPASPPPTVTALFQSITGLLVLRAHRTPVQVPRHRALTGRCCVDVGVKIKCVF